MKIKWLSLLGIFVLLMSVATYLFATQLKIESGLNDNKETSIVMANKIWKLNFSEQVDRKTINEKTVSIMNDKGEKINSKISLENDLKTLVISPPEDGYELDARFYTLSLSRDIKSVFGRAMSKNMEVQFVVKDTLPVIGTKSKLNDYFRTIIEEQEKESIFATATMESAEKAEDSSANKSAAQEVSETNVQVQGVDESDVVKTNGNHIYQIVDGKVNIIETNGGKDLKRLEAISFPSSFYPFQLFLDGNHLLVIGHNYEETKNVGTNSKVAADSFIPQNEGTKAIVFDITHPGKPKEERSISVDGHILSSRKIDSKIYLVTNQYPQYWMMREYKDADLRPRYSDSTVSEDKVAIDYKEIQYFPESKEPNYIIITAFDLEKPKKEATITTYLGGGNEMYMSKENIYIAVQNWHTAEVLEDGADPLNTNIFKFSINDLEVNFHSSTEVEGRVLNQFSMDEHEGYFRVATTKGMVWDEKSPSSNNLFIYDENLKKVSSLEDLARGERIYSARFMGERIYIVTFKETDPLFVIDASEPSKPKVMGELKIPGFSNYLHPYDENHLIGFGYDTKVVPSKDSKQPMILTEGVKLSLFDITDMKNPKEMFTEIIGGRGTYSALNYDHKALLYHQRKNLFAFPINVYQSVKGNDFEQKFEFQGAYVYNIDLAKGFSLQSKISHMKGNELYEEWENEISRLLYIGDTLYALSNSKISSYTMDDYQLINELPLNK